jgi:hypothetical protein
LESIGSFVLVTATSVESFTAAVMSTLPEGTIHGVWTGMSVQLLNIIQRVSHLVTINLLEYDEESAKPSPQPSPERRGGKTDKIVLFPSSRNHSIWNLLLEAFTEYV